METIPKQEVVNKIITWIESTADFAKEQWPDYVAQYMKAETIKSWVNLCGSFFFVCMFLLIAICCIRFVCNWEGKSYDTPLFAQMGCFIPFIFILLSVGTASNEVHNLINIYVAPKVYVLQHLKDLIK